MRYAVFGDIHGNLEALRAALKSCRDDGARKYLCVGDIVGYGPNPVECLSLIRSRKVISIAGNHDWAVASKLNTQYFNEFAKKAVEWTKAQLTKEEINFLRSLELVYENEDLVMVHGNLNKSKRFDYITDIQHAQDTFYLMNKNVCFIGHTHYPQIFIQSKQRVAIAKTDIVELEDDKKYIVNIGSIGQPRDGDPRAAYCIFDPDLKRVEIKRVDYDISEVQRKILEAGLPGFLAYRLAMGQ